MKVVFESENDSGGVAVVQIEPQQRMFWTNFNPRRLHLPYVIQVVSYAKNKNSYQYEGVFKAGLSLYVSNKPLRSLEDKVFISPFGERDWGEICTPHDFDETLFNTSDDLIRSITDIWMQTRDKILTWIKEQM